MQEQLQASFRQAQRQLQQGDAAAALASLAPLLRQLPDEPGILRLAAMAHLASGDLAAARTHFERILQLLPEEAEAHKDLGVLLLDAGVADAAAARFQRALELDAESHLARLHLGRALQRLGRDNEAVLAYFGALHRAQSKGRWLNDETTPPFLRATVQEAMDFVDGGRRRVFEAALAPVVERHGRAALVRVEQALAIYLGEEPATIPDPRQRPKFLYFPGLPSTPFFDRSLFPWVDEFESRTAQIRAELDALMAQERAFEPFLGNTTPEQVADKLAATRDAPPAWDAFFFYRHGQRYEDNCRRCPLTAQVLDGLPLVRIREHAPEICFSMLTPGSHILPHTGVTNTRIVCHLPLIVPEDCAIVVAGETHAWREGRAVMFDDTFEHEAWNRSAKTRVVLLMDLWNPHLTAAERDAITTLVGAVGDFNRSAGVVG